MKGGDIVFRTDKGKWVPLNDMKYSHDEADVANALKVPRGLHWIDKAEEKILLSKKRIDVDKKVMDTLRNALLRRLRSDESFGVNLGHSHFHNTRKVHSFFSRMKTHTGQTGENDVLIDALFTQLDNLDRDNTARELAEGAAAAQAIADAKATAAQAIADAEAAELAHEAELAKLTADEIADLARVAQEKADADATAKIIADRREEKKLNKKDKARRTKESKERRRGYEGLDVDEGGGKIGGKHKSRRRRKRSRKRTRRRN